MIYFKFIIFNHKNIFFHIHKYFFSKQIIQDIVVKLSVIVTLGQVLKIKYEIQCSTIRNDIVSSFFGQLSLYVPLKPSKYTLVVIFPSVFFLQ